MKVRVIRKDSLYYVQHKVWWFWVSTLYGSNLEELKFIQKEQAIEAAQNYIASKNVERSTPKVVWESE